ncbi:MULTISPECIES: phage holin family protein [unclassified Novosphingobium]|uniref:phage holin family protein n=1 Tax=unclassified Novosphingobium TaxID=2644732 RepID=UPI00135800E0|nr:MULTISPECIES: phage holin family protein [unclassified Novosphingobium]
MSNFLKSTLLKKHFVGDIAGAAAQFAVWYIAAGKVMQGLITAAPMRPSSTEAKSEQTGGIMEHFSLSDWLSAAGYTLLAAVGGLLSYAIREHDKGNELNWLRATTEAVSSGFVGFLVMLLCLATGLAPPMDRSDRRSVRMAGGERHYQDAETHRLRKAGGQIARQHRQADSGGESSRGAPVVKWLLNPTAPFKSELFAMVGVLAVCGIGATIIGYLHIQRQNDPIAAKESRSMAYLPRTRAGLLTQPSKTACATWSNAMSCCWMTNSP